MTLKEHLDDIRNNLREEIFTNEASVSQGILLRLLRALGWPESNTQVVIPEYSVEGGRVDFALCHPPSKPLVFIEVKAVGQIEGAERQLFEYVHRGVLIAILTDGREWRFFQPDDQGDYRDRRVYKLDLIETDNQESSERLNRYLNYELIRTGEAIRAIETDYRDIFRQRHIETSLSEAWIKLVEEADEFLIDVVAEKMESLCAYKPTGEQVLDFLKSLGGDRSPPEKDPSPPNPPGKKTRLAVTMPNGERIDHHNATDTFAEVIEKLGINQVGSVYPDLISTSKSSKYGYQVGQHYINNQTDTKDKKRILETIADKLGAQLKVEIISKN